MDFDPETVREFERDGWNRAAARYDAAFATASVQFADALLDAACVAAGTRVLDICCGTGAATALAQARGARAEGLDFSRGMLGVARARHPAIPFHQGDAEALAFPDGAPGGGFDAAVSNFGIHHVPRPGLALAEARRVLRPGARFAFTIWAAPAENIAWKLLFDAVARRGDPRAAKTPPSGGGFASAADAESALAAAGFADIRSAALRGVWRHADGAALIAAFRDGTARTAATVAAQDPAALPAIAAEIDAMAAPFRDAAGIAVPIAAIVASGRA